MCINWNRTLAVIYCIYTPTNSGVCTSMGIQGLTLHAISPLLAIRILSKVWEDYSYAWVNVNGDRLRAVHENANTFCCVLFLLVHRTGVSVL